VKLSKIFLYDEPSVPELHLEKLVKFIEDTYPVDVKIRENIFENASDQIAYDLASCRIFKTRKPFEVHKPTQEEVIFEKNSFTDSSIVQNIILYDGFEFQKIVSNLITKEENTLNQFHIVFTNKLTCTFDNSDLRYHGRTVICSNPAIISTTGIIEAPAKPRGYYIELMTKMSQGLNVESLKKKYQGTYLEYHDSRLNSITEGFILQALFYYLSGDAFCDSRDCRLNNAHWQSDLLYSQLEYRKLCEKHQKILDHLVNDLNY